ncbi:methylated-DNA--[protein]-cysteine S-methyltransferase [Parasphingopyxis sp. CP4]|uniref:methylated-DNA--[protein]-cysteine S-methyltransferase n=1 Tax=Parasphingopyxis sp. CP4 TaxID=2724527 RepID=UPI0015A0B994|nr:methylated-DNA--[protein]-cysteine S-methyltransferase [Parasphingopyxis sp. CP4]QLC22707.1 methylated-DNA--[protein]-cysteine S-methyltransferase [Parasphingopyxis sp. CP4]
MTCHIIASPIGSISISASADALQAIDMVGQMEPTGPTEHPLLREAERQINAYFAHDIKQFDLPLEPASTKRGNELRAAVVAIPYGEAASYGEVARRADSGPRAIGRVCSHNPLTLVVPCHRVIAAGGKIGYYSGGEGIPTKRYLLMHENKEASQWAA